MIKFEGRSTWKTTIPGKPIPVGFKAFTLAQDGYIICWEYTAPGILESQDISYFEGGIFLSSAGTRVYYKEKGITTDISNTQAAVERLVSILYQNITSTYSYHLYIDNLFMNWKLAILFLQKGIASTGTARKGACGYPTTLSACKAINTAFKWGAIQAKEVEKVLALLWQDNNAVQAFTTGYTPLEFVIKERKRPKKSSTNATIARAAFNGSYRRELPVPRAIDDYNHSMGFVDNANQMRAAFTTHTRRNQKDFLPRFYWLIDIVLVNY